MFTLKESDKVNDLLQLKGSLVVALGHLINACESRNLDLVITNILEDLGTTSIHSDKRAVDFRTRDWTDADKAAVMCYLKTTCGHLGAYSASDLKQRILIYHDVGLGDHGHLQVSR